MHALEQAAGTTLHHSERTRYVRVIGEVERVPETSMKFARGSVMALDDVVEYALSVD